MKKFRVLFFMISIMIGSFLTLPVVVKAANNDISFSYQNFNAPIINGQYVDGVWAINANYFNVSNPLTAHLSNYNEQYTYKLEIVSLTESNKIMDTISGSTVNNTMILSLNRALASGDYIFRFTLDNGVQSTQYSYEVGYYYYSDMSLSSSYKNGIYLRPETPAVHTPDYATSGDLIASRPRLVNDNSVSITLEDFIHFDDEKKYNYTVDYVIAEGSNVETGSLISATSLKTSGVQKITVNGIKQVIDKANDSFSLVVNIYDADTSSIVFVGSVNYNLYDFILEDGSFYYFDNVKAPTVDERQTAGGSKIILDASKVALGQPYLIASGEGIKDDSSYYYQITFKNNDGVVSSYKSDTSVLGKNLKEGIHFDGTPLTSTDITSIELSISTTSFTNPNNKKVTYYFEVGYIEFTNSDYTVNGSSGYLIVKEGTKASDIQNHVSIDGVVDLNNTSVTNITSEQTVKTGSVLTIKDKNVVVATYTVIVLGDVNCDGVLSMSDVIMLRKHIAGIQSLEDISIAAADVNIDNNLAMSDVIKLRKCIAGLENL